MAGGKEITTKIRSIENTKKVTLAIVLLRGTETPHETQQTIAIAMTQQMLKTSYYTLEGRDFVAKLNIGGLMTLGEQQLGSMRGAYYPPEGYR